MLFPHLMPPGVGLNEDEETAPAAPAGFNPEGTDYDYSRAQAAGLGPTGTGENLGHWGSVAEASDEERSKYKLPGESYVILKGRNHETWDKAVAGEEERGFKVVKHGDRYYSVPGDTPDAEPRPLLFPHLMPGYGAPKVQPADEEPSDLLRGLGQVQKGLGGTAEMFGRAIGSETIEQFGEGQREAGTQRVADNPAAVGRVEDIGGVGDAANYAWGLVKEQAAPMGTIVAGAGAGAALGALGGPAAPVTVPLGGIIGGGLAAFGINAGDVYDALLEKGVEKDKAAQWATGVGVPMAVLDTAIPGRVGSRIANSFVKKEVVDAAADTLVRTMGQRVRREAAIGTVGEAATETAQEGLQIGAEQLATGETPSAEEVKSRLLNAAVGGALPGAAFGTISGIIPDAERAGAFDKPPTDIEKRAAQAVDQAINGADIKFEEGFNPTEDQRGMAQDVTNYLETLVPGISASMEFIPRRQVTEAEREQAEASGGTVGDWIGGRFNPMTGLIKVAMSDSTDIMDLYESGLHEVTHGLQLHLDKDGKQAGFNTVAEQRMLDADFHDGMTIEQMPAFVREAMNEEQYRKFAKTFGGRKFTGREAEAVARAAYINARRQGRELQAMKPGMRQAFERFYQMLQNVGNYIRGKRLSGSEKSFRDFESGAVGRRAGGRLGPEQNVDPRETVPINPAAVVPPQNIADIPKWVADTTPENAEPAANAVEDEVDNIVREATNGQAKFDYKPRRPRKGHQRRAPEGGADLNNNEAAGNAPGPEGQAAASADPAESGGRPADQEVQGQPAPVTAEEPAVTRQYPDIITAEAEDLLNKVQAGGVPGMMTNNLKRIATENGIEVTGETTPNAVIEALAQKVEDEQIIEPVQFALTHRPNQKPIAFDGEADLGRFTKEERALAQSKGHEALRDDAPIQLRMGDGSFGLEHLATGHAREFGPMLGIPSDKVTARDAAQLIDYALRHAQKVMRAPGNNPPGPKDKLRVQWDRGPGARGLRYLNIGIDLIENDGPLYYSVTTAFGAKDEGSKANLLFERPGVRSSQGQPQLRQPTITQTPTAAVGRDKPSPKQPGSGQRQIPGGTVNEQSAPKPPESQSKPPREKLRLKPKPEVPDPEQLSVTPANRPVWFSPMGRQILEKGPAKAQPKDWSNYIDNLRQKGVKQDEIDWSGVKEWLNDQTGPVTKQQIDAFLAAHHIKVEETLLGTSPPDQFFGQYEEAAQTLADAVQADGYMQGATPVQVMESFDAAFENGQAADWMLEYKPLHSDATDAWRHIDEARFRSEAAQGDAKYASYVVPGGKNYRELLLRLPIDKEAYAKSLIDPAIWDRMSQEQRQEFMSAPNRGDNITTYRSSHFEQPNILSHVRFNERYDDSGKRTLFIEEIQSDWHQAGRKRGYRTARYFVRNKRSGNVSADFASQEEAQTYLDGLPESMRPNLTIQSFMSSDGVPDAPFKTTWQELAFKRMIRWAAENDYDQIAWTTGEQQAERYDLSKQVDSIDWFKEGNSYGVAANRNDETIINRNGLSAADLDDMVGKEVAEKIREAAKASPTGSLEGVDLAIGGEGMKGFYDKILPDFAKKYGKKWGAKVGTTSINKIQEETPADPLEQVPFHDAPGHFTYAGDTVHAMEVTPDMKLSVLQGQPMFSVVPQVQGTAQQEAALDHVQVPEHDRSLFQKVGDAIKQIYTADKVRLKQGLIDSFHAIENWERSINNGQLMDAVKSGYKAALRTQNLSSVMATVIKRASLAYNVAEGVVEQRHVMWTNPATGVQEEIKGMQDIFAPLAKRGLLRLWAGWAIANRAQRLMSEGREARLTQTQINDLLALEAQYPEFRTALEKWTAFNKSILDFAESTGVLDPAARRVWEKNDYVPFYRLGNDADVVGPHNRNGLASQRSGIHTLKGGDAAINDLYTNMMMNMTHLIDASFKNIATERIAAMLDGTGAMSQETPARAMVAKNIPVPMAAAALRKIGVNIATLSQAEKDAWMKIFVSMPDKDPELIHVLRGGKPEYFRVHDPNLLRAMGSMNHKAAAEFMKLMRGAKRVFTDMITLDPGFMIANAMRDTLSAALVVKGFTPGWSTIKGFIEAFNESPAALAIQAGGGGGGGFYRTSSEDVSKQLKNMVLDHGKISLKRTFRTAMEVWHRAGMASEQMNRVAIYHQAIKRGASKAEAIHEANDLLNFAKRGDFAAIQFLTETVPFLNARIQGLERLYRGYTENRKAFLIRGSLLFGATMALYAYNADDERYKDLNEYDVDGNYHIWIGDKHFRIPKPFEVGALFSTIPERVARLMHGTDNFKQTIQSATRMIGDTFSLNPTPQLFVPIVEQWANKQFFFNRPIVGMGLQRLPNNLQYTNDTSETARAITGAMPDFAKNIPIIGDAITSPKRLEHLVNAYFGTMGGYLLGASDAAVREVSGKGEHASIRADQIPVIKRFYREAPELSTKWTSEFYEVRDEANKLYSAVQTLRKHGDIEAATKLANENREKIASRKPLENINKSLTNIRQSMERVQRSETLSSQEKRTQLDALMEQRNAMSRRAERLVRSF